MCHVTLSMQPPQRPPKRPPPLPAELPSFASTEWVSITSTGGKYTKKRRIAQTKFDATPAPPLKPKRAKLPPRDISEGAQDYEPSILKGASRAGSVSAQDFTDVRTSTLTRWQAMLQDWIPFSQQFLDEFLRRRAPTMHPTKLTCVSCSEKGLFRCLQCYRVGLTCRSCVVSRHLSHPLHSIQVIY